MGNAVTRHRVDLRLRNAVRSEPPGNFGAEHDADHDAKCQNECYAAPGEEWTLVLTGSFSDANGTFHVGDVQSTTPDVEHQPTADPGPVCINLAVTDAPLVFRGFLPKIVGKIFGF
jgi:hypothetical protein